LERHGRCGVARVRRRNILTGRIARKIYDKEVIWIVGQKIQPRILGEIRKKLETMEGQGTNKKRDDEDNPRRGRSQGRKVGNMRMDEKRQQ